VRPVEAKNLFIGKFTLIDKYCSLLTGAGSITIGDRCHIAPWVTIFGHVGVVIEDYVGVASGAMIYSISEWPGGGLRLCGPMIPEEQRGYRIAPVKIERDVLVGSHVVIMPGVTIGTGAVVGANSVVTKSVPPWTIVAGAPTRVIGKRDPVTVEDLP
jgi:acetyltransferase-like isoleucine patch superfamily enzyme